MEFLKIWPWPMMVVWELFGDLGRERRINSWVQYIRECSVQRLTIPQGIDSIRVATYTSNEPVSYSTSAHTACCVLNDSFPSSTCVPSVRSTDTVSLSMFPYFFPYFCFVHKTCCNPVGGRCGAFHVAKTLESIYFRRRHVGSLKSWSRPTAAPMLLRTYRPGFQVGSSNSTSIMPAWYLFEV